MSFTLLRWLLAGIGHVKVMSEDEWAHIVLLAALTFTDDTALLKKSIVPELLVRCSSCLPCISDHSWPCLDSPLMPVYIIACWLAISVVQQFIEE